jgi:hypothetical protein
MLEQLNWAPEAARMSDQLLSQAGSLHKFVLAGHKIGRPQVHIALAIVCRQSLQAGTHLF